MAKSRFNNPIYNPAWLWQSAPCAQTAASLTSGGTLDAVGEKVIAMGRVRWEDGGTHDARSVRWYNNTSMTGTLQISFRDVDLTTGPPARDDGGVDQSVDLVNPAATTAYTSTMTADRASVATGDLLAVVFEVTARTAGSAAVMMQAGVALAQHGLPGMTNYLGAAYGATNNYPALTLVAADGTLGVLMGCLPQVTAITATAFDSADTPDEYALAWTPTDAWWAGACAVYVSRAAGATFDVVLYEGTTVKATMSFDDNQGETDGIIDIHDCFADVAFTVGNTYRLAVKATHASNMVTVYIATITSGDADLIGDGMMLSTRTDGGAWTDTATSFPLKFSFGLVAHDTGGAGGGGLFSPNMRGGMM